MSGSATLRREIVWRGLADATIEHVIVTIDGDKFNADGWIVGVVDGEPIRITYRLSVRPVEVRYMSVQVNDLTKVKAPWGIKWVSGLWRSHDPGDVDSPLTQQFGGALDIDLTITPLTNTLPIRRLNLAAGESARIAVAYLEIPSLNLSKADQRYTCLSRADAQSRYRFESLDGENVTFSAELTVDADGLVIDYDGLFTRVWEG